jgi:hypothetical protein
MYMTVMISLVLVMVLGLIIFVQMLDTNPFLVGILLAGPFLFALDRVYGWRSSRLAHAIDEGESLVATGMVNKGFLNDVPAALIRDSENRLRLLLDDPTESVNVDHVTPMLKRSSNLRDRRIYIELHTDAGRILFAPLKSVIIHNQAAYAQETIIAIGTSPPFSKPNLDGA